MKRRQVTALPSAIGSGEQTSARALGPVPGVATASRVTGVWIYHIYVGISCEDFDLKMDKIIPILLAVLMVSLGGYFGVNGQEELGKFLFSWIYH